MAKKNTDLLNDPLNVAKTRYREQIDSFKNQYLPKPNINKTKKILEPLGLSEDLLKETLKKLGN